MKLKQVYNKPLLQAAFKTAVVSWKNRLQSHTFTMQWKRTKLLVQCLWLKA